MKKFSMSLLAMSIASTALPLYAEEAAEVVVTASRKAQSVDDTTASVTVITREDLDTSQAQDVIEVLRLQAGVEVARSGGAGTGTSVFMRGTNSNQVLILVDGVRVSSGTTGSFAWENLSPDQIERIEIVRGPMASVYGSDAIGGVISITTRKAGEDSLSYNYGSYNSQKVTGVMSGGDSKEHFAMSFTSQQVTGFSATNSNALYGNYNADLDGYKALGFNSRYQKQLSEQTQLQVSLWSSNGRHEYDSGATDAYAQSLNTSFSMGLRTQVSDDRMRTLQFGYALDHANAIEASPSDIRTNRISFNWQNDLQKNASTFTVYGLDFYQDDVVSIDLSTGTPNVRFDDAINNVGLYWIWNKKTEKRTIQLSLRDDKHSSYGTNPSGSIAIANHLSKKTRFNISIASAFRAPSFNELFWPGYGNVNLLPESSINFEIGIHHNSSRTKQWEMNVFYNDVTNLIAWDSGTGFAGNIGHAIIPGMEFIYQRKGKHWNNAVNLTLQKPTNADTDALLARRAPAILTLNNVRKIGKESSIASELIWSSYRVDGANTLAPYLLWNVAGKYQLSQKAALSVRLENLLDYQYEYAYGYNTAGRSFYIGYQYKL